MSFILDALKRSERERKKAAGDASGTEGERPGRRRIWIWIAVATLSLNALGLAAFLMFPSGEQTAVQISLSPAGPEGGALPPPSAPAPAGQRPAPSVPAAEVPQPKTAMNTARPTGPPPAPPPAPPSPPDLLKDPEPAPPPEPVPPPEPAQPPPPAASTAESPQPETTPNMAAAKPIAESEPPVPPAPAPEAPKGPETAPGAEGKKAPSSAGAPAQPSADAFPARTSTASLEGGELEAPAYTRRGQAFEREGLYDRAIEEYTRAILIDPTFAEAYLGRGWAHLAKGNHDQAIRNYGEAIGFDPSLAEAHFARGWVYEQLGQRDRAIEEYGDAIRIAPDHGDARFSRGILRFYSGNPEPAAGDFSAIVEGSGGGLRAYALLWLYLSRAQAGGEPDRELRAHAERLDLDPWPGIIVKLYLGQVPAAQVIAATRDSYSIKQRENECVAYFFLGQERLVKGDTEKAAEYFQKTLDTGITGYRQYAAAEEELRRLGRLN